VLVVIYTYTKFAAILRNLGDEETYAPRLAELKKGALNITEVILYVKQHSINCVAATMYAMTCFDAELFPPSEAEDFVSRLFAEPDLERSLPSAQKLPKIDPQDGEIIRNHIGTLYRRFLSERSDTESWDMPLIRFLQPLQIES
jgi:hypothetical protein